jgi:tripartite ATP-independent transporter DctP family solute receptor
MKKTLIVFTMLAMVLSIGAPAAMSADFVMGIAHLGRAGDILDAGAKKWGELIEKGSGGKIKVKYYPAEQMGKEADIVTSMQMGSVEASILGPTLYKQAAPEYNIWSAYFLFDDSKQALALQDTEVGEACRAAVLKNKGIRIVGYGMRGPRHITSNFPIKKPEDVKGLKIRVPLQPIYVASWKKMGAIPTPIAFSEVYTSLKMGVVAAQENPLMLIDSAHFDEVQKYVNLTAHQYGFFTYSVSEAWFGSLPKDLQKVVLSASKTASKYHSDLQDQMEKDFRTTLEKKGMTFIESDRKAFQEALVDIPNQFESQWVPGLYKKIQDAKAKLK